MHPQCIFMSTWYHERSHTYRDSQSSGSIWRSFCSVDMVLEIMFLIKATLNNSTMKIQNSHPHTSRHWWSAATQQYCPHLCREHDIFLLQRRSHVNTDTSALTPLPPRDFIATTSPHGISLVSRPHLHCTDVTPLHGPHAPLWHFRWHWCCSSAVTAPAVPYH